MSATRPVCSFCPFMPVDFLSDDALRELTTRLIQRARKWQRRGLPPVFLYGRDSEPVWGDFASHRCSGTPLHILRIQPLRASLGVELERAARLLTLTWTEQDKTTDGHSRKEWEVSLAGVCWRVGQLYRELCRRRRAEASALAVLCELLDRLPE